MKKICIVSIIIVTMIGCLISSCSNEGECDYCKQTTELNEYTVIYSHNVDHPAGSVIHLCDNCMDIAKQMQSTWGYFPL